MVRVMKYTKQNPPPYPEKSYEECHKLYLIFGGKWFLKLASYLCNPNSFL